MFDFNPNDVSVATSEGYTSAPMQLAFSGAGMMTKNIGKMAGFQDEEDLLKEIYETSDFSTKAGRDAAIERIRVVSPEKADELSKQILQSAQTEANIVNTELQTENALIDRAKALYTGSLQLKFQNDASVNGERAAIAMWMAKNLPDIDASKVNTTAEAATLINDKVGTGSGTYVTSMNNYVGQRQEAYVQQGVYEQAGLTFKGSDSIDSTSTTTELPDLVKTGRTTEELVYSEETKNKNDSDFVVAYKDNKARNEIKQELQNVKQSLFNIGIEGLMSQDNKNIENAEDAVSAWIAGPIYGTGEIAGKGEESSAMQWFMSKSPIELQKFKANPIAYYKQNRSAIEKSTTYSSSLDNNEDLFASIPYDLEN